MPDAKPPTTKPDGRSAQGTFTPLYNGKRGPGLRFGYERDPKEVSHSRRGSKNKLTNAFLAAMSEDFTAHGQVVIASVRKNDPSTYLKVVASLVPKELLVSRPLEELSDDDLEAAIQFVRSALASSVEKPGDGTIIEGCADPDQEIPPLPEAASIP